MTFKLALSKSTRIKLMIAIDTTFFLIELISGFVAHSLALTADAFHMLNDIISLIIGLWAVVASQKETTDEFTFGWVRAEILGAFFNAVFLIALCVSIILEALTRFAEPPEINQPQLILVVGAAGLVSNLLGFVVLGGHGHDHGHGDEESHSHSHGHSHSHSHSHDTVAHAHDTTEESGPAQQGSSDVVASSKAGRSSSGTQNRGRRLSSMGQSSRLHSIEDISIHPSSFRQEIIAAGRNPSSLPQHSGSGNDSRDDDDDDDDNDGEPSENSPLLRGNNKDNAATGTVQPRKDQIKQRHRRDSSIHAGHNHTLPQKAGKKTGHNHADMGMNAMMLHVLGDALGNVGVIVTALIIWLTDWPGKLYADPTVSLFITLIILKTSIPLTLATSRILLQATPENINIEHIRQDIQRLPGVVSCHHIHVWQLSDTKIVASMHLQVEFSIDAHSGEKYMQLAKRARKCLHNFGIHSATIQPEFCLDSGHEHLGDAAALRLDGQSDGGAPCAPCLLECIEDCEGQGCCTAEGSSKPSSVRRASDSAATGTWA